MDLILTIIADPDGTNMINHTKVFTQNSGNIGRADKNDWVLPDPGRIVSSQHASIQFGDGHYQLHDTSTNGLFLNDGTTPLGADTPHKLVDGDIFSMGDYKVRVSLRPPKHDPNKIPEGLGNVDFLDESDKTQFSASMAGTLSAQKQASQFDDFLDSPARTDSPNTQEWGFVAPDNKPQVTDVAAADPMSLLNTPAPSSNTQDWDDDWWKDGSTADNALATSHAMPSPKAAAPAHEAPFQATQPISPAAPAPATAAPQAEPNPFAASRQLLQGGPDPVISPPPQVQPVPQAIAPAPQAAPVQPAAQAPVPPAAQPKVADAGAAVGIAQALGLTDLPVAAQANIPGHSAGIIRETVSRLIDLLRARNTIKNELRVQRTMIQTTDNNPLKFSASPEDALRTLFGQTTPAFLTPVAAVQDSFDDLSDHQVAVLAGTRAAYKAMLKHFSPERLEARFGQAGSLLASKGAKNWTAYCEHYQSLMRDSETTYDDLFGEEFAAAYEKQLTDLKNARALSKRSRNPSA